MPKANIHRRSTLEDVYPPDAFAKDAAWNARVPNTPARVAAVTVTS
jgi:hypothetical protein